MIQINPSGTYIEASALVRKGLSALRPPDTEIHQDREKEKGRKEV